jgi:group I intron endonuclease
MKYVIYLFEFPNGKFYVGRTNDFEGRLATHKHQVTKKKRHQLYWAIRKYGWDNIKKSIIASASTLEEIVALEYEFIVKYDSIRSGYNMTENTKIGGDNWEGRRDGEEYREFLLNMREIRLGEKNGMYRKRHSKETKVLLKEKAKGRYSKEWFISKYGEAEGLDRYNKRCLALKNRDYTKLKDPETGVFKKS